ncbi:MAG: type II toxin-antitoxin system RelE/ParE family toxin [archaeon]|jgi:Txe/YoeB family toxin of Txe-Axe toxin-antitoxin module
MKPINVAFASKKLEKEVESISDKEFKDEIEEIINKLKEKPDSGIHIPQKLWPKEYIKLYCITNLWKFDLRNGCRIIYTIKNDELRILCIILDCFSHKEYERKFKY